MILKKRKWLITFRKQGMMGNMYATHTVEQKAWTEKGAVKTAVRSKKLKDILQRIYGLGPEGRIYFLYLIEEIT